MRACVQRVAWARVDVEGETIGSIGRGLVVLLGVGHGDDEASADKLWRKIARLRIFDDDAGKTNLALADVNGQALIVSQFTLYASCKKGNRPSFAHAGAPEAAQRLYEHVLDLARRDLGPDRVGCGRFGAHMRVALENDGPFTIVLDTDEL